MIWLLCLCHNCEYEFTIGFINNEERLACPICYERVEELGREEEDDYSHFIEELGREEGDEYSRDGELPLHQMRPIPPMNDGPPPSSSSDPTVIVVPASQIAISADGLRRRNHGHNHMEDYSLVQLIPHVDNATVSGSQNDMARCGTPAAHSAVDAMPTVKITQRHLSNICVICFDLFMFGEEAREMPCKHMFHSDCILKWLAQKKSCPHCRLKFPAEDAYGGGNSESSSSSSDPSSSSSNTGTTASSSGGSSRW